MRAVYAKSTTVVTMPGGYPMRIQAGSHWSAEDPLVKSRPDLFSDDPRYGMSYSSPELQHASEAEPVTVETATAAPGELRRTRRLGGE